MMITHLISGPIKGRKDTCSSAKIRVMYVYKFESLYGTMFDSKGRVMAMQEVEFHSGERTRASLRCDLSWPGL